MEPQDKSPTVVRRTISAEPLSYFPALDGLRGFALIAVMFYHARFAWIPGAFLAVSSFFTLSGFLIMSLLLREWNSGGNVDMRRFWSRRFRRLLPAAWATLAGILVLGRLGAWDGDQMLSIRGDVPFSLLQVVNWHYILENRTYAAGFSAPTPVEHFWSLSIEEQFYLFLPLLVITILGVGRARTMRRRVRLLAMVLTVLIALSALANGLLARNSIDRAYFGTDTRMAEMLVGGLLACATLKRLRQPDGNRRRALAIVGIAGIAGTVALWLLASLRAQWMYPWGLLLCTAATTAVIIGSLQGGLAARFLSFRPFVFLGRISYGVYLVHWPIFLVLTPARTGVSPYPLFVLRASIAIGLATVMFRFLEEPIRRGRTLTSRRTITFAASTLPVLIIASLVITRDAEPTSIIQRAGAGAGGTASATVATAPRRVLVIGDQSVTALAGAVDPRSPDVRVSASEVRDCGLVLGGWVMTVDGSVERDVFRCEGAEKTWGEAIRTVRPDVIAVVPGARDAAVRRTDTTRPWAYPGVVDFDEFLSGELGRNLDTVKEAAEAVSADVVMLAAPFTTRDAPTPLPPPEPLAVPEQNTMRAVEDQSVIESAPTPSSIPSEEDRIAALNTVASSVSKSRGIEFLDIGEPGTPLKLDLREAGGEIADPSIAAIRQVFTQMVKHRERMVVPAPEIPSSLRSVVIPPAPVAGPRLAVSEGELPSVVVAGDSLAYGLGFGLKEWAEQNDTASVTVVAQFGCPVARGGRYRFQRDSESFEPSCDWSGTFPDVAHNGRPNVVMLSSGVWEVVDRQLPGDTRYRHAGDELFDKYVLAEFLTAVDALSGNGAAVAIVTQPRIESGREQGYQGLPESDPARIKRINEILHEVVELRPGVAHLIDLAGWLSGQPGRELDPARRPDGIHLTDQEARSIADWLGPQLTALAPAA